MRFKREEAVVGPIPDTRYPTYVLKSGGDFVCLINDYTQRQSEGAP